MLHYQGDIAGEMLGDGDDMIVLQGEYYNADEVQAMVAAEMLEEKRKKQEEEEMFDDIGAEAGQAGIGKKKRKGPVIAD